MPIVSIKQINENITFGVWKIEENADSLLKNTILSKYEKAEFDKIQNVRRIKEWLAARAMLFSICKEANLKYKGMYKDEQNKPHLIGLPFHISISHSFPYATALLSMKRPCGIDIEKVKPALFHVAHRFLSDKELEEIPKDVYYLCSAWAAKEVLFKICGRKNLVFKKNISLSPYELKPEGQILGHISLDMGTGDYLLQYFQLGEFIICHST